ncbi:unnamed protein product [Clonostachys byssicola]|uniref:Uncharacterized protein n=1 Tax=Clonostachys byssicola TaxID=160290 RepID=A0A9N9Y2D7_9HYPO|nr:unnamed protein product [Clonostachys byssicola]
MATQIVPYNTAMQLGSGFNSFTQTPCVDHAVIRDVDIAAKLEKEDEEPKQVAQSVTYKTCVIEKTTDVTDEMKINGAFNIKYDQLTVDGSGNFVNTNKIKDSDVSIMVSVKVVNQTIDDYSLTKFQPVPNMKEASPQRLIEIYGDSFISGWQEGGEFLAVISIEAKNRDEAQTIAADARVAFSQNKNPPPGSTSKELSLDISAKFDNIKKHLADENEVSVSVTWTGGGQQLKEADTVLNQATRDWDFDTMKAVALKFPDLCAKTPMRTHALLTKYTALRSFYTSQTFDLPIYDKTGTYTNVLQEAYLDYKSILASIQVLAYDVSEGTKALVINPRGNKAAIRPDPRDTDIIVVEHAKAITEKAAAAEEEAPAPKPAVESESVEGSVAEVISPSSLPQKVVTLPPPSINEPFAPTIVGLEEARLKCRFMMNRIIQEIDNITIKPEIATDEARQTPYLSPFLFKMLLPLGVPLPSESSPALQAVAASKIDPDALSKKFMGVAA